MENGRFFPEPPRSKRALISLTPLIDVVFILLVFFMLVSSFVHYAALPLVTPVETRGAASPDQPPLRVDLHEAGKIEFEGAVLALEDLAVAIGPRLDAHPSRAVTLRVQPSLPVQATVEVLDVLRAMEPDALNLRRLEQ